MAETYCGKNCTDCEYKETLSCPGCKVGPGKQYGGDCTVAKCCREKGHPECSTCLFGENCNTLWGKAHMPEYRIKAIEAEKIRTAAIEKRAPLLSRWLWVLFWLFIPSSVGTLVEGIGVAVSIPAISISGLVLNAICVLAYGIILIRLGSEEERYRKAGICILICMACALITGIPGISGDVWWILMLSVVAAVVSLVGEYNALAAHSVVTTGVDNKLAEKWSLLWKWYLRMFAVIFGGILLTVIIPFLGILVMIAVCVGAIVARILKLAYLCRTAKLFREYTADDQQQDGIPA